jgi:hypothetical protein
MARKFRSHTPETCPASTIVVKRDSAYNRALLDQLRSGRASHCEACLNKWKEVQKALHPTKKDNKKTLYIGVLGIGICLLTWLVCRKKV